MRHRGWRTGVILLGALWLGGMTGPAWALEPQGDVPEAEGWRIEVLADGLEHPWSMAWLPDGSALITERPGRLRHFRDGQLEEAPISGLPAICTDCGQGGLLDVSLHPEFASNRWVYLTFAEGDRRANRVALARGRLEGGRLRDTEVIFRNADLKSGGQHFGSRLTWLADGTVLMSIGDGGNPPTAFDGDVIRKQAQNLGTHFGKVVRLTEDGQAPADNPFIDTPGARPDIYSYGHRNIQGMTRDPASDRVWANEHGSRGGDELNILQPGGNYGWPDVTFSYEYWGPRISDERQRPGIEDPALVWTPSKAPSGLALYTGPEFPQWQGDLFSGALKYRQIRRIELQDGEIGATDKLSIGQRVRDIRQGPDGGLYVLTDERNGQLLRIRPAQP